jgi:hypothetical protein
MFIVIQKNNFFYNELYVHRLCEIFVVLDYDEMNYNLVFGVFTMYSEVQILVIYNNHESNERMNCYVKFMET